MITLLYILPCVFMALLNAYWIKNGKKIYHFWNGFIHLTVAGIFGWQYHWWHFFTILLIARISFDVSLNLFRGKSIDYISPEVKKYTSLWVAIRNGKILDYVEYKIFGNNGYTPKIIYIFLIVILLSLK